MLITFSLNLNLFPTGGMISLTTSYQGIYYYLDILYHLVLPATTLAIFNIAYITRVTRGNVLDASFTGLHYNCKGQRSSRE
jgi:peptide/nickel transport system permease protein